jgi:hypothetical protein
LKIETRKINHRQKWCRRYVVGQYTGILKTEFGLAPRARWVPQNKDNDPQILSPCSG